MNTPNIPNAAWTRESGYPQFSRAEGVLTVTDRYYCAAANWHTNDLEAIEGNLFEGLVLRASQAVPDPSGKLVFVTVTYARPEPSGDVPQDGSAQYYLDDSGQEIGIDRKTAAGAYMVSGYRVKWNYHLAGPDGESTPAWWSGATELDDAVAPFRWVKEPDSLRDGEVIIQGKTKNAESYLSPSPVVVEERRYRTYNAAVANRRITGRRATPGKTFGITAAWLVVGCQVRQDGRLWVVQTRYQGAASWDTDLYTT